ncbi:MAG: RNB domain-containing ribonuclease [Myxococcota bacterium]
MAIGATGAAGQRVEVEDATRQRWQVECLGEPVPIGARVRFEPIVSNEGRRGVLVRLLDDEVPRWVCTVRGRTGRPDLVPFAGIEAPPMRLSLREAVRAQVGDRIVVVPEAGRAGGRAGPGRTARRRATDPRHGQALTVRIAEVLGPAGDPDADHRALATRYRLPRSFSRRARLEAEALDAHPSAAEISRRLDLRHLPFVTIDPVSARDHDDALFAEARTRPRLTPIADETSDRGDGEPSRPSGVAPAVEVDRSGWAERLWVAIADVSHFVSEGGFIDAEARRRGNSFYFPDRALPMLPERLSSDLCSLRPDADRLALVVELRLADSGLVVDALFHEAVIRSHARLSYEEAARWLAGASSRPEPVRPPFLTSLERLARIAERLGAHRRRAGALELTLPEVEIEVDDEGRPVDARLRARNPAHGLVEEAMLAANRAVAAALERARRDAIHRVHPPPEPRRLEALGRLLEQQGVEPDAPLDEPGAIASALEALRGAPAEERLHLAALRAMSQARYEAAPRGHFALQFRHYLHFTSPIRRYADLVAHRALKQWLRGRIEAPERPDSDSSVTPERFARLAIWLSGRERVAIEAEREAAAFACCALLAGREGEVFDAVVTGVTEYGLFVRLDRPAASGLVPLRSLSRGSEFDPEAESLTLGAGGRAIEVGTRLRVRLVEVDDDRGRIAFELIRSSGARGDRRRGQASSTEVESASHSA